LTKPWEGAERYLSFFDFESGRFARASSRSLFAEREINTPAVELWLKRTIEDPLAIARPRLVVADPKALDDWPLFRAALLMLWMQGVRSKSVDLEDARQELDRLAALPEQELDHLVALLREEFDLQLVFTSSRKEQFAPLFFPSSGLFPFVVNDRNCVSGHSFALGMPLDLHCALVVTPADSGGLIDRTRLSPSIADSSVGVARATRVVVPPAVAHAMSEPDLAKILRGLRENAQSLIDNVAEKRRLVAEMYALTGVKLSEDASGRLKPEVPMVRVPTP